jgi:hypothetical protein
MDVALEFLALIDEKRKHFALRLAAECEMPETHFRVTEVSSLFAYLAARAALENLDRGAHAGRIPLQMLAANLRGRLEPDSKSGSALLSVWRDFRNLDDADSIQRGHVRRIANCLSTTPPQIFGFIDEIESTYHQIARWLAAAVIDGGADDDGLGGRQSAHDAPVGSPLRGERMEAEAKQPDGIPNRSKHRPGRKPSPRRMA